MEQNTLLFVCEQNSYLTVSLVDKLKANFINVISDVGDPDAISHVADMINGVLIYIDSEILKNSNVLIYIKDMAAEKDVPIFILGNVEEIESVKLFLPKHLVQREFVRPVDVNDVAFDIHNFLEEHKQAEKKKILVVDDSGQVLRNVKSWLEGRYSVTCANSGAMAIKYLTINKPDLVLLDYEMPIVNGKQILEMIRSESEFFDVSVIFLTGKDDKQTVMDVMNLKPDGYLLKTMKPYLIVKAVDEFFAKKKMKG